MHGILGYLVADGFVGGTMAAESIVSQGFGEWSGVGDAITEGFRGWFYFVEDPDSTILMLNAQPLDTEEVSPGAPAESDEQQYVPRIG